MKTLRIVSILAGLAAAALAVLCHMKGRSAIAVFSEGNASQNADIIVSKVGKMMLVGNYAGLAGMIAAVLGLLVVTARPAGYRFAAIVTAVVLLAFSVLLYRDCGPLIRMFDSLGADPLSNEIPDFSSKNWLWLSDDNIPQSPRQLGGLIAYSVHLLGKKGLAVASCALLFALSMLMVRLKQPSQPDPAVKQ